MRFHIRQRPVLAAAALALAVTLVPLSAQQAERVDLNAVYKIKDEGFQRSRVMEIMSWLTDVYGPRLTNSPGFRKAGDWAVKEMTSWGLVNVKLQPFGPFGRGWANDKFYMMATTPGGSLPVIGYAQAWTSSTNGLVSGDAVFATIDTPEDIATWKGKLKGQVRPVDANARRPGALRAAGAALHPGPADGDSKRETVRRRGRGGRGSLRRRPRRRARLRADARAVLEGRRRPCDRRALLRRDPAAPYSSAAAVRARRARPRPSRPSRSRSSTTAGSCARCRRISRCGSRWKSRTRSTTIRHPSTSSARLRGPTRPTRS